MGQLASAVGELTAQRHQGRVGRLRDPLGDCRHDDGSQQCRQQQDRRRGQREPSQESRRPDDDEARRARRHDHPHDHVQHSVDVDGHPDQQVATSAPQQGRARQPVVDPHPQGPLHPQGQVMADETFGVAEHSSGDTEESHPDSRGLQIQHWRHLRGP